MSTRWFPSGGRYFSTSVNVEKTHPILMQLYDASVIWQDNYGKSYVGGWRPVVPQDLAANISLSGVTLQVGSVAITGNPDVRVSNLPTVYPVSGIVTTSAPSITPVSGYTTITNFPTTFNVNNTGAGAPAIQAVSGYVRYLPTETIKVWSTGTSNVNITNPVVAISGEITVGNAINVASAAITGGDVTVNYPYSTSVSTSTPGNSNGTAIAANNSRKTWFIQNNSTGSSLYVKFGTAASATSYNLILKAATEIAGGDGGTFLDDGARWRGAVSVSGQLPNYIAWELV